MTAGCKPSGARTPRRVARRSRPEAFDHARGSFLTTSLSAVIDYWPHVMRMDPVLLLSFPFLDTERFFGP